MNEIKMNEQLKPCPFCGSKAYFEIFHVSYEKYEGKVIRATCSKCKTVSPYGRNSKLHGNFKVDDVNKAIEAWNRRIDNDI